MAVWVTGSSTLFASENLPQKPFAQQVDLPSAGQWLITPWYSYAEFFHVWRGTRRESIETAEGEDGHGFDQNTGWVSLERGFSRDWAADFSIGYTSAAARSFRANDAVEKTSGMADVTFGLRRRVTAEGGTDRPWLPALTLRAGGIYRGNYEPEFPYAPGSGSVGIETALLARRHVGWEGFGIYGHTGFRWMRSGGHDQWFGAVGFQQEIESFTINAGYRHLGTTGGIDVGGTGRDFTYSRQVREVAEVVQGGVGYTDHGGRHYQFALQKTVAGRNTGSTLRFDVFIDFPLGGK